ncbi:PQQ-binding-like beta-propeller repeat protein [Kitasatospora terrestris]|uniref:Pyrrolo-quinoline quinone repeat domain-containing protein n=1 Tax=Kitasatospora terrestris TaxID=258051 RepID=A0ABP9E4Y1_9ACTN
MAQEPSSTSGQGYPQQGYDYQQPWYPQQPPEPPAETWNGAYQQQPDPQYQQDAYGYQQPAATGYPATGYPEGYAAGYDQQQLYAQPGSDQQLYAQPGTEQYAYTEQQAHTAPDTEQQAHTAYLPQQPEAPAEPLAAEQQATLSPYTVTPRGEDGPDDAPDERPAGRADSLLGRAKAAAGAVVSGDGAPSRRAFAIRAGAGVAALAVLVTAGVLATGDDEKPAATGDTGPVTQNIAVAHDKAWTATPAEAPAAGTDDTLTGSWLLADAVVRADATGVRAYSLADGKPTWTLAPPAAGAVPCGLSPTVNAAGLGAAVFRPAADPKSPCTVVAAVDTKAGKTTWTKTLSDIKENYGAHVAVTDEAVFAVGDDKAAAWAAADGKDLWQYAGQGKYCTLAGNASGKTVLLHSSCADSSPVDQAVALNAADGKVRWWRGLNNQPKTVTVLSAEPAAVLTTGAQPGDDRIFAWGTDGDPAAEIPVAVDGGRLDAARGSFDAIPGVYFHEHTLLAAITSPEGTTGAVAAYDLTTGKPLWKTPVAEKGKARPVGLDGGGLLLAVDERVDQPAHISRFALTGGQETQGGAFQRGTGSQLSAGRLLSGGGKVVSVPEHSTNFGTATAFSSKG